MLADRLASLTDDALASLWREATFIFDTNVLLNLYELDPPQREQLLERMRLLADRVWLPAMVAEEFAEGRPIVLRRVLEGQNKRKETTARELNTIAERILRLRGYDAALGDTLGAVAKQIDLAFVQEHDNACIKPNGNDPVAECLDALFSDRRGVPPSFEQRLSWYESAERRYRLGIPPGYVDATKPAPQRFNDALIWFEVLDYARQSGRPVIFVTNDRKEDWWLDHSSKAPTIPHLLLFQELKETNPRGGYLLTLNAFTAGATKFLAAPVEPELEQSLEALELRHAVEEIFAEGAATPNVQVEERAGRSVIVITPPVTALEAWEQTRPQASMMGGQMLRWLATNEMFAYTTGNTFSRFIAETFPTDRLGSAAADALRGIAVDAFREATQRWNTMITDIGKTALESMTRDIAQQSLSALTPQFNPAELMAGADTGVQLAAAIPNDLSSLL